MKNEQTDKKLKYIHMANINNNEYILLCFYQKLAAT